MAEQKKKLKDVLQAIYNAVKALVVQSDYAQNDSTQPDYIKNRTHYVENVSTSNVWYQTGCSVGSGTTSPGGYPATFNITTGDKYNVTISQGSTSKTYEGLTAEYDSVFNGLALRKNWSDSMGMSDTSTDALLLVVQPSNVVLRSADIYGENCTVQVSEVTETIHKLDPKYLPDNVNQLEDITTSKSGKVTTVTMEQTNGTQTQFQVTDGNDGTNGKSAYQVAVDNGYSGTEAQWLASLKGADGVSLGEVELTQEVTTATDSVPANKAVYDKVQRVDVEKANKSNYDDNQWLQDQGWKLDYKLFRNTETAASGYCISPMFPFVYGHTYTFSYQFNANNNCTFSFFTDDGVYKEYYSCNANNVRTVTASVSSFSSCTQMRGTFSLSNIRQCYIHDDTTNEYIFKGDEYFDSLIAESDKEFDNLIDYKTYINELLVQKLNQSTTQVPSAKAVQDGIEVWRDDIEYIYKASDLTFDGSNYVDTGWNPYNPEGDFYIKMEISDLVLVGMENNAMIISCCKQISPYPGFAIRRDATNNSQIAVYIDGTGRWNTTVNTGAGSKNTIVFSRVGNVYTFQVNGGVENTFTSTTTYNVDATNLYIGAQLNADLTTFYRYGKFHLDSLVIARHEAEGVQLYSGYKKELKIYPKTTIANVIGSDALFLPVQSFYGTLVDYRLSDYPTLNPLKGDGFTLIYDKPIGKVNESNLLCLYNTKNSSGAAIGADFFYISINGWQYQLHLKKNGGTEWSKNYSPGINGNSCLIVASFNLKTGEVNFYVNGVKTRTDTFSVDNVPNFDSVSFLSMYATNYGRVRTIFNGCITDEQAINMLNLYPNNIIGKAYENMVGFGKRLIYRNTTWSITNGSIVGTSDGNFQITMTRGNNNCYVNYSSVFLASELLHYCKITAHLSITEVSDTFTFSGFGIYGQHKATIYDGNGDVVSTGVAKALNIGEYDLECYDTLISSDETYLINWACTAACKFTLSKVYVEILGAVIDLSPYTYRIDYWELYNGIQLPISSSAQFNTGILRAPIVTDKSAPEYPGQLRFYNNNVYIGYIQGTTCVWKQISN